MTLLEKKTNYNENQMCLFVVIFRACSNRSHTISVFCPLINQSAEECSFFCLWISIQIKINNVRLILHASQSIRISNIERMNIIQHIYPINYSLKLNQLLIDILPTINQIVLIGLIIKQKHHLLRTLIESMGFILRHR